MGLYPMGYEIKSVINVFHACSSLDWLVFSKPYQIIRNAKLRNIYIYWGVTLTLFKEL